MLKLVEFLKEERGVTTIEYALIAGFIALGIIVALSSMGGSLQNTFNTVAGSLP